MHAKTKYILHGGNIRSAPDGGNSFFQEMVKDLGETPTMLLCFFAQPQGVWVSRYQEWSSRISEALGPLKPKFVMAEKKSFKNQAAECDALFIYGGDNELLLDMARQTEGFIESLSKIKVVAGSSAGAILLAEKSWGCDRRRITNGLGIVRTNTIVHYASKTYATDDSRGPIDWVEAEYELRSAIGKGSSLTKLPEAEFVVF